MPAAPDLFMFQTPFDPDVDWLEQTPLYSPSRASIGRKRSTAWMRGYIPFPKILSAISYFLGYSYHAPDGEGVRRLHRSLPAQHPYYQRYAATEITEIQLISWTGERLTVEALPANDRLDFAEWRWALTTVKYTQSPVNIRPDNLVHTFSTAQPGGGNPASELMRFCTLVSTGEVDPLTIWQGQYVVDWPSDPNVNEPATNVSRIDGRPYPSPSAFLRNYLTNYKLTIYNVPYDFFYNAVGQYTNIGLCIGRINNAEFFPEWPDTSEGHPVPGTGLAKHTCLLNKVYPVDAEVYSDPAAFMVGNWRGQRRVDMCFEFLHFDPPNAVKAYEVANGLPISTQGLERGWRLHPYKDMKFYPSKTNPGTPEHPIPAGTILPEEANFDAMFGYRSDT